MLRFVSLFHLTSDAHPVVRPETLLFPNETYTFLSVKKKKKHKFFPHGDNFLHRYYYLPFDKLSIISFFLSTEIRFSVECSCYPSFTYFMELPPPADFISNESGQRDKFIAVGRVELCEILAKLFQETIH